MAVRGLSLILVTIFTVILVACGAGGSGNANEPDPLKTNDATPVVASTPIPTQSGPPVIRTSLNGACRLTAAGAQIRVEYSVTAFGSTTLSRVVLLQDGKQIEDSGVLDQRSYSRITTVTVGPGEQHTYRVSAESPAGQAPNAQTTVRCGREPTPSPGPRA